MAKKTISKNNNLKANLSTKKETKKTKTNKTKTINKDKTTSAIEQYYEWVVLKSNQLVEEGKYNEALMIIEDELDAPYIPLEQEQELEELAKNLRQQIEFLNRDNEYDVMSHNKLFSKIFENNRINQTALMVFFDNYKNEIKEDEIAELEDYLISRKISNSDKVLIFSSFKNAKINRNVKFYNCFLKEEFYINTMKTNNFYQFESFQKIEKIINDMCAKDPSVRNFCITLLEMIYVYNFPKEPSYEPEILALSIFEYMLNAITTKNKKTDPEIFDYIDNIIKKMQEN